MGKENNRIVWLDQLRAIAFLFVIIGHVANPEEFNIWIYSFHMPLFFMISGMTFNREKIVNMPITSLAAKLARGYIVPYFWLNFLMFPLWYIVFKVIVHVKTTVGTTMLGIITGSDEFNMPSNALWFLTALFCAEMIFALLLKFTKGNEAVLFLCVALCGLVAFLNSGVYSYFRFATGLTGIVYMYIGNCLMRWYKSSPLPTRKKDAKTVFAMLGIALLSGGAGWWLSTINGRISMVANKYGRSIIWFYLAAVTTSIAIILIVMLLPKMKVITLIGQNTLFYLGVHIPIIRVFEKLFPDVFVRFEFALLLAFFMFFALLPLSLLAKKLIPFACGRPSDGTKLYQVIFRILCTIWGLFIPVYVLLCLFGFSIKVPWEAALLLLGLTAFSVAFVLICGKYVPVIFNDRKPEGKHLSKNKKIVNNP